MSAWAFLREFARDPRSLGAVAPSGPALARLEVAAAEIADGEPVVEIGAGTGPMTAELVHAHPTSPLLAIEPNPTLVAALRARFPDVRVEQAVAQDLPSLCAAWGHPRVRRVVSGLPWAIWPDRLQSDILDGVLSVLSPDGRMVSFQYVHSQYLPAAVRFHKVLEQRFTRVTRTGIAWANVPPAFVLVCDGPRSP
jgi:phosphatidylethanolamine/phosphatidyl-N-methylethanolamine N-methyltransferase